MGSESPHPEALRFPHPSPLPEGEGAKSKSAHSEYSARTPLPLGEDLGEGAVICQNWRC